MLVIFAILLMMARVGSGKLGEAMDAAVEYFKDMFSMCSTDLGTVPFADLMLAMDQVFEDCKYDDKDCGKVTCLKLDLTGAGVPCYQINRDALWDNDMREFCGGPCMPLPLVPPKFELFCKGAIPPPPPPTFLFDYIMYDGLTGNQYCLLTQLGLAGCYGRYFSVGDGADIKLSAKKRGTILVNTDLTVKVSGGTGYPACVPYVPPAPPPPCTVATEAADCTKTTWGWCDVASGSICRYDHFCVYRTADPRCIKKETTCGFSGGCIPAANIPCPAIGVQSDLIGLIHPGTPTLRIDYSETSLLERLMSGSEKCFGFNAVFNTYGAYASCDNPLAKVSMAVVMTATADPNKYNVTYYQGCY